MMIAILASLLLFFMARFLWFSISGFYFDGAFFMFETLYWVYFCYSIWRLSDQGWHNDIKLALIPCIFTLSVIAPAMVIGQVDFLEHISSSGLLTPADLKPLFEDYKGFWVLPFLNVIVVLFPWGRLSDPRGEIEQEAPLELVVSDPVPEEEPNDEPNDEEGGAKANLKNHGARKVLLD